MPFDNTPVESPLVADLEETRRLLVEGGWCQGMRSAMLEGRLAHCLSGAAEVATYAAHITLVKRRRDSVIVALSAALVRTNPTARGIVGWNDTPGRTIAEVLALVDDAIAHARQEAANAI